MWWESQVGTDGGLFAFDDLPPLVQRVLQGVLHHNLRVFTAFSVGLLRAALKVRIPAFYRATWMGSSEGSSDCPRPLQR